MTTNNSIQKAGKTASANSVNSVNSVREESKVYNEMYRTLSKDAKQLAKGFSFQAKSFLVLIAPTNVWFRKSLKCSFEKNEGIDNKIAKCLELAKQNAPFIDSNGNICTVKYLYSETETYPNGNAVKTGYKYVIKSTFTLASILQLLYKPAKSQVVVECDKEFSFTVDENSTVTIEVKADKVKADKAPKAPKADKVKK